MTPNVTSTGLLKTLVIYILTLPTIMFKNIGLRLSILAIILSHTLGFSIPLMIPNHSHRLRHQSPQSSILRAIFSGSDAAILLKPESANLTQLVQNRGQYIGKVVSTRPQSLLVRIDDTANTTDVFVGSLMNQKWIMWQVYWGSPGSRNIDSKIIVFMDIVSWLKDHNISLTADFNNITDWKAWHEASIIIRDKSV